MSPSNNTNTAAQNKKSQRKKSKPKKKGSAVLSQNKVVRAISGTGGIVTQIAEKLQCSRITVYSYINKYEKVKTAYDDEKDRILDVCEEGLIGKIYDQDLDAIKYYLGKKGQERGYSESGNGLNQGTQSPARVASYTGIPAHLIGPSFGQFCHDVLSGKYEEFWLRGGRGSLKSTTVSEVIPDDMVRHPDAHAVVLREIYATQKDSCYSQLIWAIDKLGMADLWTAKKSPLELIYNPTGQIIYFRGLDDPLKLKSIKPPFGYIRNLWFEEVAEVDGGMETIRNVKQSLKRGGEAFNVFHSYNPPKSKNNWVNIAVEEERLRPNVRVYHSDYTTVPRAWLGEPFILDAEHLKEVNPLAYEHEYLGVATGTGGDVFDNVALEEIPESVNPDMVRYGVDFGYAVDPFTWCAAGYDHLYGTLYVMDEIYSPKLHDDVAAQKIKEKNRHRENHFGDCSDAKGIDNLRREGINISGCKKFNGSREHGYKFLQRWAKIVIDPRRCPNAAREFTACEYERDKDGNFLSVIPKKNDHMIDAVRYALDREINGTRAATSTYVSMA